MKARYTNFYTNGPKAKAGGIAPPSTVLETVILLLNYANVNHNSKRQPPNGM